MPEDKFHESNLPVALSKHSDRVICDNILDSENKARALYCTVH